ncbi:MAG: tRNA 2-thiouridine(34) synthase MnmA [Anaerolineales bacterium]|nr:tRNA 2-thiouridine(34) synthase MnmA [Anaerolineales bacterium]
MSAARKERVVVAMSGGVDSSVAAALLVEQGYEVIGMMMRLWSEPTANSFVHNRCCTPDQMADARRIAAQLGIPFYVVDVKDHFRQTIVQFFIDQHRLGRTPNPCIECNRQIRFTYLLNRAFSLDADYLATGHYAQVLAGPAGYELHEGVDASKDQSYVLHMLNQEHLAHVKFPVGGYAKAEVRALAEKFNLPVASKKDSMDLCFLGDGDYRRFLQEHAPESNATGPILTSEGEEIGQHQGLAFYTIGQRKGLGVNTSTPVFVLEKDVARNALIVGAREELGQTTLAVRDVNWIAGAAPDRPVEAAVKIRYKAQKIAAAITATGPDTAEITFASDVFGITSGQGAVFYEGSRCLGGGIIADREPAGIPLPVLEVAR